MSYEDPPVDKIINIPLTKSQISYIKEGFDIISHAPLVNNKTKSAIYETLRFLAFSIHEMEKTMPNEKIVPTVIYLVVYDWVDGTTIYDAFTTSKDAGDYIENVLKDTRRCQIQEIKLWGNKENE